MNQHQNESNDTDTDTDTEAVLNLESRKKSCLGKQPQVALIMDLFQSDDFS